MVSKLRTEPLGLLTPGGPNPRALTQACCVDLMSPFSSRGLQHPIAIMVKAEEGEG